MNFALRSYEGTKLSSFTFLVPQALPRTRLLRYLPAQKVRPHELVPSPSHMFEITYQSFLAVITALCLWLTAGDHLDVERFRCKLRSRLHDSSFPDSLTHSLTHLLRAGPPGTCS